MVHTSTYIKTKQKLKPIATFHLSFATRSITQKDSRLTFKQSPLACALTFLSMLLLTFFAVISYFLFKNHYTFDALLSAGGALITVIVTSSLIMKSSGTFVFQQNGKIDGVPGILNRTDIIQVEVVRCKHINKYDDICFTSELRLKTNDRVFLINESADHKLMTDEAIILAKFIRRPAVSDEVSPV